MPKTPEQKAAMLARLKAGKEKAKAERDKAKAEGKPDPKPRKPRKPRAKKADLAIPDPLANKSANDTERQINEKPKPTVSPPTEALPVETKPIDVPFLPEDKKKILEEPLKKLPPKKGKKPTDSSGVPPKVEVNDVLKNMNTGTDVIPVQFPKQAESIKKLLKENKKLKTESPAPVPHAPETTVQKIKYHVPDVKAVERQGKPFSFNAIKTLLYQ